MNKAYSRIVWENYPSLKTAINETNLNKIDSAVDIHDDRIIEMDTTKANQVDLLTALKEISVNEKTGVITVTKFDGSTVDINTNMSKVAVNFRFDSTTQQLIITLEDGTETPVDLSAFITDYEFVDSDTVGFSVGDDGKVKAIIKEGSIAEKYLDPNYLAEVRVQASNAEKSATDASQSVVDAQEQVDIAKSWAVGGTGKREGEDGNNAKVFAERAEKAAQDASDIAGGKFVPLSDKGIPNGVATLDESGKVPKEQIGDIDLDGMVISEETFEYDEPTGKDADTLEGHSASYFATKTEFEEANTATSKKLSDMERDVAEQIEKSSAITDDTTGSKYKLGIANGMLYIEEVQNG